MEGLKSMHCKLLLQIILYGFLQEYGVIELHFAMVIFYGIFRTFLGWEMTFLHLEFRLEHRGCTLVRESTNVHNKDYIELPAQSR